MWMFVERKLEEAARKGAFDHLPGAGLPLDLTENPYVPADWRLAFKILADHKIVPEFVERRKTIESIRAEMDALASDRTRDLEWRRLAYRNRAARLAEEVAALNGCLVRENQFVRGSFQLPPIDLDAELRAFDTSQST
jgi:DnaJ homologue, subfamily C, member 28, conserved domain